MAALYWQGMEINEIIVGCGLTVDRLRSGASGKPLLSGLPSAKRAAAKPVAAAAAADGGPSASPAVKKAKKEYFTSAQLYVLASCISVQMNSKGDSFSRKDDRTFFENTELQVLRHVKDMNNKNVYLNDDAVIAAPAEVHAEMTTRISTFVHTNLGRKWRKWLASIDTSTSEKKQIALDMIEAVYYPQGGAAPSTVKPWACF